MAVLSNKCSFLWCFFIIVYSAGLVSAQEQSVCYGPGSIAASVILTFLLTALLLVGGYFLWRKYKTKKEHLILETDPEKGTNEYAFDNPGFKDTSLLPASKSLENTKVENTKSKWNQWSPLSALTTKSEKRKTVDDTALETNEVKVVALRSHDFTGLGFNICGNMKEGIFIKDILHRGPAFESGKLNPGDRINSVTISFEHMVYEDALTILSYASPYEVMIEAKSGKLLHSTPGQGGQPSHPVYRSSSCADLYHVEKSSKKRLFVDDYTGSLSSNYSSLQKSRSNMTTLERKESKSPRLVPPNTKKTSKNLSPEQLKTQLEQRILSDHHQNLKAKDNKPQKVEAEIQKTENKHHKFGIRVLPLEQQQKSPKILEQNENNMNIEKNFETVPVGIDEVDEIKPQVPPVKKREKKLEPEVTPEKSQNFERTSLNGSGIRRDEYGIPQEIPNHMFNAAVAARKNRRNSEDFKDEDESKTPKRKGKAPSPPAENKTKECLSKTNFDEIQLINEDTEEILLKSSRKDDIVEKQEVDVKEEIKDYNSDSDIETDNQSSVNTIELNSSDITIHTTEEEERQNRKTASTGDLTKIQRHTKASSGTLERAQSLDITDTGIPGLTKRKGGLIENTESDGDLFGKVIISKEPRLSLILDGLTDFQRNRLKKSTEWGNLEDAILKLNQEDESATSLEDNASLNSFKYNLGDKSPEFDALVNKINEIKRESLETDIPVEIEPLAVKTEKKIKNQIWPSFETEQTANGQAYISQLDKGKNFDLEVTEIRRNEPVKSYDKRQQIPTAQERNLITPPTVDDIVHNARAPDKVVLDNKELIDSFERRQLNPVAVIDIPTPEYREEAKIAFSSIQLNSKTPEQVRTRQRVPEELPVIAPPVVQVDVSVGKVPEKLEETLTDDWDVVTTDNILNTSPPLSLGIEDEVGQDANQTFSNKIEEVNLKPAGQSSSTVVNRAEEVLSKIPLLNSMVKSQKEEAMKKPVLSTNSTDETKTVVTYNTRPIQPNLLDVTQNFLYTEQLNSSQDDYSYSIKPYDTNISDDIKVSRHSQGSLERQKSDVVPKSDDAKSKDCLRHVSNVNVTNVTNGDTELHSLELSINEPSELYTTALDSTVTADKEVKNDSKITISTPDLIKNVTLAEAISTLNNDVTIRSPTSLTVEIPKDVVEVTENKFSTLTESPKNITIASDSNSSKSNSTLTYITEIQVLTPNSTTRTNISEIEITPNTSSESSSSRNLDSEFENYVKNFESKLERFENNIQDFDKNLEEFIKEEPTSIVLNEKVDENEVHKIEEIAEEQLKKLPEMRFTTSSYEASKIPEKRQSQIEILRSNFEKPSKPTKPDIAPKSRIPIATTKTPPMSPERRDSRNLDTEHDKALLELMSSSVTSTPYTTSKYQMKSPTKNVTVTSIRSNSKIPSGLPTLSSGRPPIAPRKIDTSEGNVVQVSTNGNIESSFKQWVFNPSNVTNVMVTENKQDK